MSDAAPTGRRLCVVQLLPALDSGGVERSTIEIAHALVQAGHRAIVVSAGGRLLPLLREAGAEHVELDIGRKSLLTLRHARALRQLFERERPDVVHARSRLPAWLGAWALRRMPPPRPRWVTTAHGLNSPGRYSRIMASGERVVCVSETVRDYLLAHYADLDPARLVVVPRGIDPAVFHPDPRPAAEVRQGLAMEYPGLAEAGPLLLMPGRGTRIKGHADGIDLLASLHAAGCPARLWLLGADAAGREAYLGELRQRAAAAGVADALLITPPRNDIRSAYAAADLVLQLSRKPEAFGRTVLEALSMGRPVLGWDHGGVGELLARLYPAGRVALGDMAALARIARALLDAPPPTLPAIPFTLRAMQDATLSLYDQLIHA